MAELSAGDIAKLSTTLTPLGGEKAGNAAAIPAWNGGITKPAGGLQGGAIIPDPFAADKPLSPSTPRTPSSNKRNLTHGQMAMLKKYPSWKMMVYPSRRSSSVPQKHYEETRANATQVKLAQGGNGVVDSKGGIPFPVPKGGNEAIWNHSCATAATPTP